MKSNYRSNGFLALLPGCFIVKGAGRALIQDTTTNTFDVIPNEFADIINQANHQNLDKIYANYGEVNFGILDSYFDFIIKKGYAYFSKEMIKHPSVLNVDYSQWDTPYQISNAIIDYNEKFSEAYIQKINELAKCGCNILQLRFFGKETYKEICNIVSFAYNTGRLDSISLVVDAESLNLNSEDEFEIFMSQFPIITELILFNSIEDNFYENKKFRCKILKIKQTISSKSCGAIQSLYFSTTIQAYTESLQHNTCLNRKIGIDTDGFIKNCPSMNNNFGHINDTTIEMVINCQSFKDYWFITKNEIQKCKDCEFRHVCTDCRAYIESPEDLYSAPLKCGYNPYTNDWDLWSKNPLKQKAIDHYQLR
ncbi:grasp-with-spasm system SPASM domain peptide maturase [Pedobacter sp. B4-66]|uniref:grasp-with-spasm system SPASM domain peptide maturase n=1 Tax=Pedobacter sp. B4-66 TaxID=2817280 RepID=UPI001BD98D58|nr:grasp-with-spasm system SPASM domain peptide maturase [Pedobacter sp. B4-66]